MNIKFLFPIICGLTWAFRGWTFPKSIHGYYRSFLSAFIIIGYYCLCTSELTIFNGNILISIIYLGILESILGFGNTCEDIDWYKIIYSKNWKGLLVRNGERFCYLGLIGMCYYLLPALTMSFSPVKLLLIASIGSLIFPGSKVLQMFIFNDLAIKYKLDSWKIVEFVLGMGFGLWLI